MTKIKRRLSDSEVLAIAESLQKDVGHRCSVVPYSSSVWVNGYIAGVITHKGSNKVFYAVMTDDGRRIVKVYDSKFIRISDVAMTHSVRRHRRKAESLREWTQEEKDAAIRKVIGNVGRKVCFGASRMRAEGEIELSEGRIIGLIAEGRTHKVYYRIRVPAPTVDDAGAVRIIRRVTTAETLFISEALDSEGEAINRRYNAWGAIVPEQPFAAVLAARRGLEEARAALAEAEALVTTARAAVEAREKELSEAIAASGGGPRAKKEPPCGQKKIAE